MLAAIRRLLFGEPLPKNIFEFRIRGRRRTADPLDIDRRLIKVGGEDWIDTLVAMERLEKPWPVETAVTAGPEAVRQRGRDFAAAIEKVEAWSREVFGLPPLQQDGTGVSGAEAIAVLFDYISFANGLAESAVPLA